MKKNGFTLLFTVLFVSASLAVSLGLSGLIMGQIQLSGTGRDSQLAFYASDTGVECARYWDGVGSAFATSSQSVINCAGVDHIVGGSYVSSFSLNLDNGSCVEVTVDKTGLPETVITSLGRNPCDGRKVERGLRVRY
ncbi:MAG: hypothetical protein HYW09_01565 [Candidatus Niyogibacteria bacterium]|nr:hypothetical protein [Candidatus Niyogibacteria bacterium]